MHLFLSSSMNNKAYQHITNLVVILCIVYFLFWVLFSSNTKPLYLFDSFQEPSLPTSLDHIVFGIAANQKSWMSRKEYVRSWWRPNQMRGCVFLESTPPNTTSDDDETASLPPVCVSDDTSRFPYTYRGGLRSAVRVARVVMETVALNHSNVRWFVFGDDDTVFFPENLVKTLSKYDHELWYYIGANSEVYMQNRFFSFDMAFGGAGFAISYPLAKVLANVFDSCLLRYPHLYGSDGRISSCVAELGIGLTLEPGFHQMDMRGNTFGLLAAHPLRPLVSLHHLDAIDPLYPNMSRIKALEHLNGAAVFDPHRLLQQTVCYDRWFSWTVSVSWGYAVQIFPNHVRLPDAIRPHETFKPWKRGNGLNVLFSMNTKPQHSDPCQRPTIFFLDKVTPSEHGIKSNYRKMVPDNCTLDVGSPKRIEEVRVFSPKLDLDIRQLQAPRRHCCDVLTTSSGNQLDVTIRECQEEELICMQPWYHN